MAGRKIGPGHLTGQMIGLGHYCKQDRDRTRTLRRTETGPENLAGQKIGLGH